MKIEKIPNHNERAITLIALVVTIVLLVIVAAVVIRSLSRKKWFD